MKQVLARPDWIWGNVLFFTLSPLVALAWAAYCVVRYGFSPWDLVGLLAFWAFTAVGITAGYHRLFSHRGWSARAPVRLLALLAGGMAGQNSAITWCAGHRYHHRDVDTPGDPYNVHQGFWHAHWLWLMQRGARHGDFDSVPDLRRDRLCAWQHRHYLWVVLGTNVLLPAALGLAVDRLVPILCWAGLVRLVLGHHLTFLINSAAHTWGSRPWNPTQTARDNWLLALLTFGEGYHNFHHTFQADYRNGIRWFHWDPTKWTIFTLSKLGLAHDLRRTPMEVLVRRRFEQGRAAYRERMDRWSDAARERALQAERRLEEALAHLQGVRAEWARRRVEMQDLARSEFRKARGELERAQREAQDAVRDALEAWQHLVREVQASPA